MIVFCISVVLFYEYKTNYNWRYRDFLKSITDVENKDNITEIKMNASLKHPATTFKIYIKGDDITEEQIIEMTKKIAENIEELAPDVKETLPFNPYLINLFVYVVNNKTENKVYSCHAERTVGIDYQNGISKSKWIFTITRNGQRIIIDEILVDTEYFN